MPKQSSLNRAIPFDKSPSLGNTEPSRCLPCIGHLAGTDSRGRFLVRVDGSEPIAAKVAASLSNQLSNGLHQGSSVLLVFEKGDPNLPVIVDLIAGSFDHMVDFDNDANRPESAPEAYIDGKRVVLDGEEEIVLRCGAASITLKVDGRIILKGVKITSRASEINKIKGAAVRIN